MWVYNKIKNYTFMTQFTRTFEVPARINDIRLSSWAVQCIFSGEAEI
jgi:hypothetical protein